MTQQLVIGIDPGVSTGFAIWDATAQQLIAVEAWPIHIAMSLVHSMKADRPFVMFEDARQRKVFSRPDQQQSKYGAAIREGAGSVKRDCKIWEEYLAYLELPFKARPPMVTKWKALQFQRLTKWQGKTNEHARDAAMIVYGLNLRQVETMIRDFEQRKR